jgi:DmsE family decaheme c-type cytochrome
MMRLQFTREYCRNITTEKKLWRKWLPCLHPSARSAKFADRWIRNSERMGRHRLVKVREGAGGVWMKSATTFGVALKSGGPPEGGTGNRGGKTYSKKILTFVASGLVCWALFGFTQPVKAEGPTSSGDSYSALADFVQRIGVEKPTLVAAAEWPKSSDDSYSALADFVQRIGAEKPKLVAATEWPKSSDGSDSTLDDSYSALADFVQRIGAEKPKLVAAATAATNADNGAADNATYVGSQVCATCHAVQAADFGKTLMGKIFLNHPRSAQEKLGCENCHGPGSAHVAAGGGRGVGGIIAFRKDSPLPVKKRNAVCLACHENSSRTYWEGSQHDTRGLACTDCHQVMKQTSDEDPSVKTIFVKATEMETCFQCHKDKRAQLQRFSHHPLLEGKMTCSSCHEPHGSPNLKLLKEATPNDTCYGCHADKRGPFLFEHPPVRENCLNCHNPHGSNNDKLLIVSPPRLCQECHSETGHPSRPQNPAALYAFNRGCANCHGGEIHGSNSPSGARLHR